MELRDVDLRSVGPSVQKLWPTTFFAKKMPCILHCNAKKIRDTISSQVSGRAQLPGVIIYIRVEWIHAFLEIAKGPHGLWSTSQHWFQNNWRNHYRMNILLRNQENSFYRECKLQHSPISSNLFDEWDFCKHSHSQCCDAVQNHLEFFKILTPGAF